MLKRLLKRINERCSIYVLIKIIAVLLIVYLLLLTQQVWGGWVSVLKAVLQPFLIGFVLAYIIHPLVTFLERKRIPKNFSILAIWLVIIVFLVILLVMLMPILYTKINEFIISMVDGVKWISDKIKAIGKLKDFSLVNSITDNIVKLLESYDDWMPGLVSSLPGLMNTILGLLTNFLFSIIIAIYMLFDFERIKHTIHKIFHTIMPKSDEYLKEVDENVTVYLRSLIILMVIKFIEYCTFYFLIGHPDWMIIGFLTSLGVLVPYLGGTIANSIGIITALTLPGSRIMILIIGILILSNVDAYVISPLVHEKRSALGPLVTLFAVFVGGVVMGAVGIMVAVPVAIVMKTIFEIYHKRNPKEEVENM